MTSSSMRPGCKRPLKAVLGLCLGMMPGTHLLAAPHVATVPAGVQVLSMFNEARLGDQPLSGVQVLSSLPPEALLELFQQHWQQTGGQPIWRDQVGGWTVLSRAVRFPYIEVLQVRSDGRGKSLAFLSQADVTASAATPDREHLQQWLPGPFRLLQSFVSRDPARENTTFLAATSLTLPRAQELMAGHLRARGLQLRALPHATAPSAQDVVAMYTGAGVEAVMTLHTQADRTLLVLHVSVGQGRAQPSPAIHVPGRKP